MKIYVDNFNGRIYCPTTGYGIEQLCSEVKKYEYTLQDFLAEKGYEHLLDEDGDMMVEPWELSDEVMARYLELVNERIDEYLAIECKIIDLGESN